VFKLLAGTEEQNSRIEENVKRVYGENRTILVLTERTDHLLLVRNNLTKLKFPGFFFPQDV
jgi:hypothetical protein